MGVAQVQSAVTTDLDWIFREQPIADYGIDAHIEIVDGDSVSGRLIALQIKSGSSYFSRATTGGWWFTPEQSHINYWLAHSLPVVVVLVNPSNGTCYWESVTPQKLVRTSTGPRKLRVPENQQLSSASRRALEELAQGDPYEVRWRELLLAKPWMDRIQQGTRLILDFEEWVNKSSGRGAVKISIDPETGSELQEIAVWEFVFGPRDYAETVPQWFAWAHTELHEETYLEADQERYEVECAVWGSGGLFTETFDEWRARLPGGIRPYRNGAGEVDFFRLELSLNELGRAFLVVDSYASTGGPRLLGPR